jgi:hemerythrin
MILVSVQGKIQANSAMVKWHPSYSVNISGLDQQHRMMMLMHHELKAALQRGQEQSNVQRPLEALLSLTLEYFANEESLFEKFAYPWAATHKSEHETYRRTVTSFLQASKESNTTLDRGFPDYCDRWLKHHIISCDKLYSYFFTGQGLK